MHCTHLERQIADAIAESSLGSGLTSKVLLARIKLIRFEWFGVYWTLSVRDQTAEAPGVSHPLNFYVPSLQIDCAQPVF